MELRTPGLGAALLRELGASLKWQRLKPYEKFAEMIDRHWDGIAAYCRLENKVSLGFVERLNNKIWVIQRRAYGLRKRGLSTAQNPHLHATGAKAGHIYPSSDGGEQAGASSTNQIHA